MYELVKKLKGIPEGIFSGKNPSEAEQLDAVKINGHAIKCIENPSEKVQLAAVSNNYGQALRRIKNPSEKVQLIAVKQSGYSIEYIKNPSEEIKMVAIETVPKSIIYIKDPSEDMKIKAITKSGFVINYLRNPTEEMKLIAVKNTSKAIKYITDPNEELQMIAVRKYGVMIIYIEKPTEKVRNFVEERDNKVREIYEYYRRKSIQILCYDGFCSIVVDIIGPYDVQCFIEFSGEGIKNINDISEEKQIEVVNQEGILLRYIKNPTEPVKLRAVQRANGNCVLSCIENPSERVQLASILYDVQNLIFGIKKPHFKPCVIYYLYQFDIDYPNRSIEVSDEIKEKIDKMQLHRFNIETYQGQHDFLKEFPELYECILEHHISIMLELIDKDPTLITLFGNRSTEIMLKFISKVK